MLDASNYHILEINVGSNFMVKCNSKDDKKSMKGNH